MEGSYDHLLRRLRGALGTPTPMHEGIRLEVPEPQTLWVGNKTIFRNFMEFARRLRRDPNRLVMFLAKELATAASIDGERAIFIGRRDRQSFSVLIGRYMKEMVLCPVCGNPDTRPEKVKRLQFLVCEACGARSPVKSVSG